MEMLNPLPNYKTLDWAKLKAFADDNLIIFKTIKFKLKRVQNIVGKGENAGYQHFLLFPRCFYRPSSSGSLKVWIVWYRVNQNCLWYKICLKIVSNLWNLTSILSFCLPYLIFSVQMRHTRLLS